MQADSLPSDWKDALAADLSAPYFQNLQQFVAQERQSHPDAIFPAENDVFRALELTPLTQVRVVILGQDPYPTRGHAHGLAFSVQPEVKPLPASLRNIMIERESDLGLPRPSTGSLIPWANQGVLLLNTALTVREGEPNSHQGKGWETFTDAVIKAVSNRSEPAVFILWGKPAQRKEALIDTTRHTVLKSAHPSPLSAKTGFFGSKPFSRANAALVAAGYHPIDWSLG